MSYSKQQVYGLTEEEAKDLESDDEEFYGEVNEVNTYQEAGSDSDLADVEEIEEHGILDDGELSDRILRVAVGREHAEEVGASHESTAPPDLIIPDSDPVYSDIASKLSSGCVCSGSCLSQFSTDEVYTFHLSLFEMSKGERDMLILGKLQVLTRATDTIQHARQSKLGKRQRITCDYSFDHRRVCRDAFLFLHNIGTKQLQNLRKHLQENGPVPWQHGLVGRIPATTYRYEVVSDAVHFIRSYAEVFGIPQPAARSGRAKNPPIYLPASQNYTIVHAKYVEACLSKEPHMRFLKYKSFIQLWQRCLPDIVFMTPRSDVCSTCEAFRIQIRDAVSEVDKVTAATDFASHIELAQQERDYYLDSMKKAESQYSECPGTR